MTEKARQTAELPQRTHLVSIKISAGVAKEERHPHLINTAISDASRVVAAIRSKLGKQRHPVG